MERVAFYGGSFDPPHKGHIAIAQAVTDVFALDRFVFIPAHHAPHKKDRQPTSPFHRFAMLALATEHEKKVEVSAIEMESPERPYTFETLSRLKEQLPDAEIFFVIGADSWAEITTWREWETVLTIVNIIVVTRPEYEVGMEHVTDEIRKRVVDLRSAEGRTRGAQASGGIFITDAVYLGISATGIREKVKSGDAAWKDCVTEEVANYIEKYQIYT